MTRTQPATIEELYRGFHEVGLVELSTHLKNMAELGIVDPIDAMWARKEVEWDIDHLTIAVDKLCKEESDEWPQT